MHHLEIKDIQKSIDGELFLRNINLKMDQGEIMCFLGPSGCGKTTLLRIIAGLDNADQGDIIYKSKKMSSVPSHHRRFGMMFQEFALFPHKNVFENIAFGLRIKNLDNHEIFQRTTEALKLFGLEGMANRNITELSGGERQRVALARSLAPRPRLLLLDEPMGSLDRVLRERLIQDLHTVLKKIKVTTIFVTHDHNEAFAIADRIAVFNVGCIEQIDEPETLYKHPANKFVAGFLGFQNLIPGKLGPNSEIETEIGTIEIENSHIDNTNQNVILLIRPEAGRMLEKDDQAAEDEFEISGEIVSKRFQGASYKINLLTRHQRSLIFYLANDTPLKKRNDSIRLAVRKTALTIMPNNYKNNLAK